MGREKRSGPLLGEPVLTDALKPDLGSKFVEAVAEDMERAHERRRKRREAAAGAGEDRDGREEDL